MTTKKFNFSSYKKILFYVSYLYYKTISPIEVRKPRWKMFINEMFYSAGKLFKSLNNKTLPYKLKQVTTCFGTYNIRPNSLDSIWASPAFERCDVNYLLQILEKLVKQKKKILFLDIGADFGAYSITVGNRFKNYANLHIHAYEPSRESYELLSSNIVSNKLESDITAHNFGLFDVNDQITLYADAYDPGANSLHDRKSNKNLREEHVKVKRLDDTGIDYKLYDAIIFKIDVEGVESNVLDGAINALASEAEKYLVIEDFVNPQIVSYLENVGANFYNKVTSYNSWWNILPSTSEVK